MNNFNNINGRLIKTVNNLSVNLVNRLQDKANRIYAIYENYFGIKELKQVQTSVLNAEKVFTDASKSRREAQAGIHKLQEDLKRLRQKLDSTNRADEQYLALLTEEHKLIRNEVLLMDKLRKTEEEEREKFTYFSNRLRESQDFDKVRQEKLKYISLIFSLMGAALGIIATSVNHSIRQRDLNNLTKSLEKQVDQEKEINLYTNKLKEIVDVLKTQLDNTDKPLDNNIIIELKSIKDQLSNVDRTVVPANSSLISDNSKLNILLGGITMLSLVVLCDILIKSN